MTLSVIPTPDTGETPPPIDACGLTPQELAKWNDTMSMMVWVAPGFRHLFYKLLATTHNAGGSQYAAVMTRDAQRCPIACTDGQNIILNPDQFFKMSLAERVFVAAHEIVHNVYNDVDLLHRCASSGKVKLNDGSTLPFKNETLQKAMDARINALLIDSKIGKPPQSIDGRPVGHYDKDVKADHGVLDVYKKYYMDEHPDGDGDGGKGDGGNPGGFDNVLPPGNSTGNSPAQGTPRNSQQWAVEIATAQTIEASRTQGKMGAALKRMFQQLLEPEVPWVDHIETLINRTVGDGGYDWTHPDEWLSVLDIYSPKPTGRGAGWIVCWGDTSGSRSDKEVASNLAELAGIMAEVNPARLTIIWCDADINYVDEIADPLDLATIQARGAGGGGGTDIRPVLDWIDKNGAGDPDLFIGFTDLCLSFPDREPRYPVIWAASTASPAPWGQIVKINSLVRS